MKKLTTKNRDLFCAPHGRHHLIRRLVAEENVICHMASLPLDQ